MNDAAAPRPTPVALAAGLGACAAALAVLPRLPAAGVIAGAALLLLSGWTLLAPHRWLVLFLAAALLLPPLPFALGNSGPHPALLFAALGVFVFLAAFAIVIKLIPYNLWKLVVEERNLPLAIVVAALTLGLWCAYFAGALSGTLTTDAWALMSMLAPLALLIAIVLYGVARPFLQLEQEEEW